MAFGGHFVKFWGSKCHFEVILWDFVVPSAILGSFYGIWGYFMGFRGSQWHFGVVLWDFRAF